MAYRCDTCDRTFTKKRNLKRHINEQHNDLKYWKCTVEKCSSKFIRRSNLKCHLEKLHKFTKDEARKQSIKAKQFPTNTTSKYSDVSDDDSVLDMVAELDEFVNSYDFKQASSDEFLDSIMDAKNVNESEIMNGVTLPDVQKMSNEESKIEMEVDMENVSYMKNKNDDGKELSDTGYTNEFEDVTDEEYIFEEESVNCNGFMDENENDKPDESEKCDQESDKNVNEDINGEQIMDNEEDGVIVISDDESVNCHEIDKSELKIKHQVYTFTVTKQLKYLSDELVGTSVTVEQEYFEFDK